MKGYWWLVATCFTALFVVIVISAATTIHAINIGMDVSVGWLVANYVVTLLVTVTLLCREWMFRAAYSEGLKLETDKEYSRKYGRGEIGVWRLDDTSVSIWIWPEIPPERSVPDFCYYMQLRDAEYFRCDRLRSFQGSKITPRQTVPVYEYKSVKFGRRFIVYFKIRQILHKLNLEGV